jgi:hypothetical protein
VPTNRSDCPRPRATSIESGNQRRYNRHSVWQAKSAGTLVLRVGIFVMADEVRFMILDPCRRVKSCQGESRHVVKQRLHLCALRGRSLSVLEWAASV